MNTTLNYTNAQHLLEQGKNRDAYAAFLSVVELSTQQLHEVKFVHQTIVSTPLQYQDALSLLRSSLDQLEKIAKVQQRSTFMSPPPVPPKPVVIQQKPIIPPKPKEIVKRTRGNSVSFAENLRHTAIIEHDQTLNILSSPPVTRPPTLRINTSTSTSSIKREVEQQEEEDDDDDDDDDVVIDFESVSKSNTRRPSTAITSSGHHQTSPTTPRLRGRSKSWVVQSDSSCQGDSIDVLLETVVDPKNLVPAQTNTGDSLAIPSTTATSYLPNIPAPPLLATHRRLQQRLNELECDVEECDNDLLKLERNHKLICARQTLEKVRTLYMSAMTIPSILQFPPHLMAYQLTLIESCIFRQIPRQALLSHSARAPHRKMVASTDFFNFLTRSIEHSILLPQEASKRAEIIHRWIKIATKLLSLNNYQTLKAIVSALGTPPVQRLRRTWDCIPKKRMGRLDLLNCLMSETDNYQKYREHIALVHSKPVIPFLGVFIHDVTYLLAASNNARVQEVLHDLEMFQRTPEYPQHPPASLATKKHLFHFGSTKNTNRGTTAALMGEDQRQETEIELEQQLIVQYILMRPWVSEKTIDALSSLREPSKPRPISSPTTSTPSNGFHSPSNGSSSTVNSRPSSGLLISPSVSTNNASNASPNNTSSSILSNASSFMRFNTNNTIVEESPILPGTEEKRSSLSGFWPFRKSTDLARTSMNARFMPQEHTWSGDEEEEEDEEDEEEEQFIFKHGQLVKPDSRRNSHNRSLSLPTRSLMITE